MPEDLYGSLLPQNANIYNTGSTALQSDAVTGQIFGGTASQQGEAASLMGGSGGVGAGAIAGVAGEVFSMFDKDKSKYGNANILGDIAGGVAKGAALGPYGMLAFGGKALIEGLGKKNRQIEHDKKVKHGILRDANAVSDKKESHLSAQSFFAKQNSATAGAYGIGDIDNFLQKNRV
mgnify:CR=1 FL=1|tara:strand:+ start:4218 stop:4748 length:531 start_codon:yes stop_codon:yes gene_type:complete